MRLWLSAWRPACRRGGVCAAGGVSEICATAPAVQHQAAREDRYGTQDLHVRRYPCSALAFAGIAACACLIACSASISAAAAPRGSAQMKSPTRTKSAPAAANSRGLLARAGKADAGRLEQFGPPLQALGDRLDRRPLSAAHRARRTARNPRPASPAAIESCRVASPPTPAMRSGFSVGSASSSAAMPVRCAPSAPARATSSTWPSSRSAAPLSWIAGASALIARDHGALVGRLQPQQHGGDIGGCEQAGQACDQRRRIVHLRRREIETRHRARRGRVWWPNLCRLLFQIGLPFALARERIHPRAMDEGALAGGDVSALPDQAFCGAACSARP